VTALDAITAYLPDRRVPVGELAGPLGLTTAEVRVLQRFHGLSEVRRQSEGGRPIDLLVAAAKALPELNGQEDRVRYVLYARGVPVATPYSVNPVQELCQLVGLGKAIAFTVTHHACATSLLAVDIAGRLLSQDGDPDALALIVAGESVFTRDLELAPESRVFGEGAGACLVSSTGTRNRLLSYVSRQRGDLDHWLAPDSDAPKRFARAYRDVLTEVMLAAAERAGSRLDEITLVLPHNVNVVSWQKVCRQLEFPIARVLLDNVPLVGHTFAADAFINYRSAMARDLLRPGDRFLVAAAGFGATFSAMVFEH
jgi:3-oxoacyl-[acyl-carrier-protein] synthase III